MKVTPALVQNEFIGLKTRVVKSTNQDCIGVSGKVVDETKNTLIVRNKDEDKAVVKNISVFHFTMPDGTKVEVDGKVIIGRPEDRLKKKLRRRW